MNDMPERPEVRSVEPAPSQRVDPMLYRWVVYILGTAIVLGIVAAAVLSYQEKPGAELLMGGVMACIVGLVGMLKVENQA